MKNPPKEKPKSVTIHEVKRTRRFIFIEYDLGDERHRIRSSDNPLPSLLIHLDELSILVTKIIHVPPTYATDLKVMGMKLGEQGGSMTVSIIAQKSLDDASKALVLVTPHRLLEHPTQEGSYTPPLAAIDRNLVDCLIEDAKQYVLGNRAQGQLPLDQDVPEDEGDGASADQPQLPAFAPDTGSIGKPTKKSKK